MLATTQIGHDVDRSVTVEVLDRLRDRTFGSNDWVTLALQSCEQYLEPAIASGKPFRIANALRTIAHAPTPEQVDDVIESVFDALLARAYSRHDTKLIGTLADARKIASTVVSELSENLDRQLTDPENIRGTVDGLTRLAALADRNLGERLDAVGALAARIASAMQLPYEMIHITEFAGRLHDIGMINALKDRTLKMHSVAGEAFVAATPDIAHLAPFVRSHHERFDGLGFPDGLRADEIPLPARIVGTAAAFIELVTGTPRHKALSPHDACLEVSAHSGTRFDPEVVSALLQLLRFRHQTNRTA